MAWHDGLGSTRRIGLQMLTNVAGVNMLVVQKVIEQHAEEAAFQWLLRNNAVGAPHYSLRDLAKLDSRVDAHIDGLRIASTSGWDICKAALVHAEAGEVFTAAILAIESKDKSQFEVVLEVGSSSPELFRGLVSALGWLPYQQVERHIKQFLTAASPDLRRLGIAAYAVHRQDPGHPLTEALSYADPLFRARALRAVGQLGRVDLLPLLQNNLTVDDVLCRFSAAWSTALLGDMRAIPPLQSIAGLDVPYKEEAAKMALRRMDLPNAHGWQKALAQSPASLRLAVIGAGVISDPMSIPWLIEQMATPELARVAGEAFTMITGVDIVYEDLEGEWPEGFEAGPTEDPEDDNVDMDLDEDLPWPKPEAIHTWWRDHQGQFRSGTRYLLGKPMSPDWLRDVLRNGRQRQRAAAALELALQQPGQPLFEIHALGFRQQQFLLAHS
jgi:uncharacterized protein (TIGR02270 family)